MEWGKGGGEVGGWEKMGGGETLASVELGGGRRAAQVSGDLGLAVIPWKVSRDRLQYFQIRLVKSKPFVEKVNDIAYSLKLHKQGLPVLIKFFS